LLHQLAQGLTSQTHQGSVQAASRGERLATATPTCSTARVQWRHLPYLSYVIVVKRSMQGTGTILREAVWLSREAAGLSLPYHLTGRGR
jgi:hypothetical protein